MVAVLLSSYVEAMRDPRAGKLTCIDATNAGTGIFASVIYAGFRTITFGILYAFGTAASVWIAEIFRQTETRADAVAFFADGIGTAWRWRTGIYFVAYRWH